MESKAVFMTILRLAEIKRSELYLSVQAALYSEILFEPIAPAIRSGPALHAQPSK